jgi:hypothetical protein
LSKIKPPLLTCEAVIVETCFLLKNTYGANALIFSLLKTGKIMIPFCLIQEVDNFELFLRKKTFLTHKWLKFSLTQSILWRCC